MCLDCCCVDCSDVRGISLFPSSSRDRVDRTKGETAIVLLGAGEAGEEGMIWTGLEANIMCVCVVEMGGIGKVAGKNGGRGSGRQEGNGRKGRTKKSGCIIHKEGNKQKSGEVCSWQRRSKRKWRGNKKGWGAFMGELGVELWLDPVWRVVVMECGRCRGRLDTCKGSVNPAWRVGEWSVEESCVGKERKRRKVKDDPGTELRNERKREKKRKKKGERKESEKK